MNWQKALGLGGVALIASGVFPAHAQRDGIERSLAGIRINSSSREILRVFGNPNDIQIGDVAVRPPTQGGGGGGQQGGMGMGMPGGAGMPGGMPMGGMSSGSGMSMPGGSAKGGGGGMGMPGGMGMGMPGAAGMPGGMPMGAGMPGGMGMGMPGGMGSSGMMGSGGMQGRGGMGMPGGMGMGMPGGKGGMGMGGDTDDGGMPGMGMGMPGGGGPGMRGSSGMGGSGIGAFGQTTSSATMQQEVTWSYSMKALDAKKQKQAIGYDFLISPEGKVSQIRVTGYVPRTKGDKSSKGITLGSTYKDLIRTYGTPKSVMKSGELLVCSYPKQHIEFQLMNMKFVNGYPDVYNGIYKVVAIQINSVE